MNDDVFRAILAMDAYNHAGVLSLTRKEGEWNKIGTASIVTDSSKLRVGFDPSLARELGFSATAYRWTDSKGIIREVISYRGTDINSFTSATKDIWNGWSVGAGNVGFVGASQAGLARQFFDAVLNPDPNAPTVTANVELVGHSLGGGLAGFVSSQLGGTAYVYDHMPFGLASWAQTIGEALDYAATATGVTLADALTVLSLPYDPLALITGSVTALQFVTAFVGELNELSEDKPDFRNIVVTSVEGEFLSQVRNGFLQELAGSITAIVGTALTGNAVFVLLGAAGILDGLATAALESQIPNKTELSLYGAVLSDGSLFGEPLSAHSIGLLTILEYADKQWGTDAKTLKVNPDFWTAAAIDILPALQNESIAGSLGLIQNQTGAWAAGGQLAGIIAYSAIDVGVRPFGDTGIRALFGDASDLGRSYYAAFRPQLLVDAGGDLGKLAVEYAGLLAYNQVMATEDTLATKGVLQYLKATANRAETLTVDLRESTWTKGDTAHIPSVRDEIVADLLSGIDAQSLARAEQWYGTVANPGSTIARDVSQIGFALSAGPKPGGVPGAAWATGLSVSVLSDGGNTIKASGGRDLIIGGKGDDIINGGAGSDILISNAGYDELNGGAGDDLLIAGTGGDRLVGGIGVDTFLFDPAAGVDGAMFVGGKGNDIYDLRGTDAWATIEYRRGDGLDVFKSDADSFDYSHLKLSPDGSAPWVPLRPFMVQLVDLQPSQIKVVWDADVIDTVRNENGQIDLLVGRLYIKNNTMKTTYVDLGVYAGTHLTADGKGNSGYYFAGSAPKSDRLPILFGDEALTSIGDGVWPDMIVI